MTSEAARWARSSGARPTRRATQMLAGIALSLVLGTFAADARGADVPLVIGSRTIHVFRGALGDLSAEERAEAARRHIDKALDEPGEGWTSIVPWTGGVLVTIDGRPMFTVIPGDVPKQGNVTAESLANQSSRVLQKVWSEARERRAPSINLAAVTRVALALALVLAGLTLFITVSRRLRRFLAPHVSGRLERLAATGFGAHFVELFLGFAARLFVMLLWLVALLAVFAFVSYALEQFALTRPAGEGIEESFRGLLVQGLGATADALPGLFVAIAIFIIARVATQVSRVMFDRIAAGGLQVGALDAHTAPATRHLVNAAIWLFALAMAYPYLPGSHTEAFKGLSVLLGIMVSIGASGLIGQIASGMILVFTRALLVGEYVSIQECEGTVTEIGLCVTRLRTGTGEEIALPNSLVIGNVTRNFSRHVEGGGFTLDASVTIGYDTPWRQVHAMLLEAAARIAYLRREPAPFVVQTALSDFYVGYRLVAQVGGEAAVVRPRALSELNAAIQDVFNRYGVQIMSPHYLGDPGKAKLVPESQWHLAPAAPDRGLP